MVSKTVTDAAADKAPSNVGRWAIWVGSLGIWFLPLIWIDVTTYMVLTIAGFAFGMLLFMVASGMTIIFGLMDVLNMAHGALFALGAYTGGYWILNMLNSLGWVEFGTFGQSTLSLVLAILGGAIAGGLAVALATRALPKMMSQMMGGMMQNMMARMGEEGCDPSEM